MVVDLSEKLAGEDYIFEEENKREEVCHREAAVIYDSSCEDKSDSENADKKRARERESTTPDYRLDYKKTRQEPQKASSERQAGTVDQERGNSIETPAGRTRTRSLLDFYSPVQDCKSDERGMTKQPEDKDDKEGTIFKQHVAKLFSQVKILVKTINTGYPKKEVREIKHIIQNISDNARKLQTGEQIDWLKKAIDGDAVMEELDEVKEENLNLKKRIKSLETQLVRYEERQEKSTQTEELYLPRRAWTRVTRETVKNITGFSDFDKIRNLSWDENIFRNIKTIVGNPVNTVTEGYSVVLVEAHDQKMNKYIQKLYRERFPELIDMKDDFESLEQITRTKKGDEQIEKNHRVIKIKLDDDKEDVWQKCVMIRNYLETNQAKRLTMHKLSTQDELVTKKMLQAIFMDTDVEINFFVPRQSNTQRMNENKNAPRPQRIYKNTNAITLNKNGATYDELLTEVKEVLKSTDGKEAVRTIRSNRDGEMMIVLDKDDEKTGQVSEAIKNGVKDIVLRKVGERKERQKILHLKHLDALVTKEEVESALLEVTGGKPESLKVGNLRPARARTQAVTIVAEDRAADLLLKTRFVQVGSVRGTIYERIEVKQCYRCWSYGHVAAGCTGEDKRGCCFRCGKHGHLTAECKEEEESCILCKIGGHRTGSNQCNALKSALRQARIRVSTSEVGQTTVSEGATGIAIKEPAEKEESLDKREETRTDEATDAKGEDQVDQTVEEDTERPRRKSYAADFTN